jgi:hypothetical protein
MSFPIPPSITKGQLALDPVNGIVYYKDENNNTVSTTWSWLQNLNQETNISSEKNVSIEQDLTVGGDLIIGGDTVSLNVSEVLIEDNILVLNYNFTGAPILNAGIEIERGSENNVQIRWNEADNKWQFTNDGTTFLDLNSIIENSVTLGLHTTGNYVKNLIAGTGVTISNPSGEGATPNISIGQPVATTDTVTFAGVTAPLTGNVTGNVTGNLTGNVNGNITGNLIGNVTGNVTGTVSDISNHGINALSDVAITSSADGDFLRWTGSAWVNDAVNLTSDTVGDYVKNLVQGNGLTISNNSGEGATPNIAIDTSIVQTRVTNITDTEIGYLDGVTSAIQTQIDAKAPLASPTFTGSVTLPANTISQVHLSDDSVGTNEIGGLAVTTGKLADGAVTSLKIANDTIVDADINSAAAIAQSKISGLTTDLGLKAPLADPTFTGTVSGVSKSMVGLGNVDNTSDANKPVSTAQQTALDLKANSATPTFTGMATIPKITVGGIEIDTTSPADTNVLKYNASLNKYIPGVASTVAALDDLTDVIISAATPNQVLKYDGYNWVNANAPSGVAGSTYFATIGNDFDSTFTVTHGLSTRDIVVSFTETEFPYASFSTTWEATTLNAITVYFETVPSSNSVRVSIYAAVSGIALSTDLDSLSDVALSSLANGDFLRYNGLNWINDPVNLSTDTVGDYVSSLVAGTGITITNNSGEGATPTISVTSSLDDLTDVSAATPITSQPLIWDGTNWQSGSFNQYLRLGESGVNDWLQLSPQSLQLNPSAGLARFSYYEVVINDTVYQAELLPQELKWTDWSNGNQTKIQPIGATNGQVLAFNTGSSSYVPSDISIDSLSNVSAATPSNDEVLAWQSSTSQWINKTFSASVATLDAVGDVAVPAPSAGEFLAWSGSSWVNSNLVRDNQINYFMDVG